MTIGMGIIGLGVVGRRILGHALDSGEFAVPAAWDLEPDAVAAARAERPEIGAAASADAVIGHPGVDVVYIATPPLAHAQYARDALAAGKAVFCEKPLAADAGTGEAMVRAAAGARTAVNFVYASAAGGEHIREALARGEGGPLRGVELRLHFCRWPRDWQAPADWLRFRDQGGFLREVVSHFVYLGERLLGPARVLAADVVFPADAGLAETAASARLDLGGVPMSVLATTGGIGPDEVEFTVRAEQAAWRLDNWYWLRRSDGVAWSEVDLGGDDPRVDAYRRQLGQLARMLRGETHDLPDFAAAFSVQRVVEAILTEGGARLRA